MLKNYSGLGTLKYLVGFSLISPTVLSETLACSFARLTERSGGSRRDPATNMRVLGIRVSPHVPIRAGSRAFACLQLGPVPAASADQGATGAPLCPPRAQCQQTSQASGASGPRGTGDAGSS